MREIGVRELKTSLSETLRAVHAGEHVRVTRRGRPIADILPAGAPATDPRLRALTESGRLTAPQRPLPADLPPLAAGRSSASAAVLAERDDER